jgi:predicted transposase YbfD/YdcC
VEAGLPGARTLVVAKRTNAAKDDAEPELAYYHSSETLERRPHPSYFANLVRGHWAGCEIRNHWVRDSIMQEDRTRIRDYNINANLATLRCCLLAIKSRCLTHLSWPQISETAQYDHAFPYQLVANYRVK